MRVSLTSAFVGCWMLVQTPLAGADSARRQVDKTTVVHNGSLSPTDRIASAARLLKKPGLRATGRKGRAILLAHEVGAGEPGRQHGTLAGITSSGRSNYTRSQLLKKLRILRGAGFSSREIRLMTDHGIAGSGGESNLLIVYPPVTDAHQRGIDAGNLRYTATNESYHRDYQERLQETIKQLKGLKAGLRRYGEDVANWVRHQDRYQPGWDRTAYLAERQAHRQQLETVEVPRLERLVAELARKAADPYPYNVITDPAR